MADIIFTYNGKRISPSSGKVLGKKALPALAPRSMRFDFKYDHFNPITGMPDLSGSGLIWTHVANDVYDFHYDDADWGYRVTAFGNGGLFNLYGYKSDGRNVLPMTKHQFDVLDMDMTGVTNVSYLFNSAWPVQNIFSIRNTSAVTNFTYFVGHNNRNIAITSIPLFDMSSATTAERMFANCTSLTSVPLFNTSNVTNMSSMFNACKALTTIDNIDMTACTNAASMFQQCISLTTIGNLNLPVCTNASSMFKNCTRITSIGNIYLPSCTNASSMFNNCTNLTTVGNIDLSACTSCDIFTGRTALTTVGNIDISACKNATNMFQGCSSLVTVPAITTTSALRQVGSMFARCYALETIPLFNTSRVTSFFGGNRGGMCYQCTSLKSVPLFDTSSATDVTNMFSGCTAVESGALALYQQMSTQTTPPTTYTGCFANCGSNTTTGAAELAQIPTSWGGTMAE